MTWNTNGGSPVAQMIGISRLPTPLPITVKERNTFKGWYTNALFIGDKVINGQVVNTNMILYAKFVEAIEYELDDGIENIVEKMIQPYNSSSNKVINQNKYFLYAPAAGLDKVGMAGYKSGDFDVNSKQIVSISSKFKKTIIQNIDINSIPDNIRYEGVNGIKTINVFYNNYTNEVIDTINRNNIPSYINVTGTLLVSLSTYIDDTNYSTTETFIANGCIWTRVLVVVNDEIIEVTDFTRLVKQFEKNTAFNKNFGNEDDTVCEGNDVRLSDARTPLSHTHDDRYYTESEVDTLLDDRYYTESEVDTLLMIKLIKLLINLLC